MNRYFALAIMLTLFFASTSGAGGHVGATSVCENGNCYTAASASLMSLMLGVVIGLFALFCPRQEMMANLSKPVGIFQRFGAFLLDFMAVLAAFTPAFKLPILYFEAQATGIFAWSFSRDFARSTDALAVMPGILLAQISLVAYFYFHAAKARQTIGQYILGYRVAPVIGAEPNYISRTIYAVIGMCMWPISTYMAARRLDKAFWWDRASGTKVERVAEKYKTKDD